MVRARESISGPIPPSIDSRALSVVASSPADRGGSGEPAQPTLRRMRRFGVRPDRELGQNFLVDSNILGVIGRLAELDDARRGA